MEGLNRVVADTKHRQELVAGGLDEFMTAGVQDKFRSRGITNVSAEYCSLSDQLRGNANDFWSIYFSSINRRYHSFEPIHLLKVPLEELPQVCPSSILRSRTSCFPDHFHASGGPEAGVHTCLPCFPPPIATVIRHICEPHY